MSDNGKNELEMNVLKNRALRHHGTELEKAKILPVLSFYMKADSLPEDFKGIDTYVSGVRNRLESEVDHELNQAEMILLDSLTETLLISRYISAFLAEDLGKRVINTDKYGISRVSDLVCKGFSTIQGILEKKMKLYSELTGKKEQKKEEEEDGYIAAITGKLSHKKGGKEGRPTNKIG